MTSEEVDKLPSVFISFDVAHRYFYINTKISNDIESYQLTNNGIHKLEVSNTCFRTDILINTPLPTHLTAEVIKSILKQLPIDYPELII